MSADVRLTTILLRRHWSTSQIQSKKRDGLPKLFNETDKNQALNIIDLGIKFYGIKSVSVITFGIDEQSPGEFLLKMKPFGFRELSTKIQRAKVATHFT